MTLQLKPASLIEAEPTSQRDTMLPRPADPNLFWRIHTDRLTHWHSVGLHRVFGEHSIPLVAARVTITDPYDVREHVAAAARHLLHRRKEAATTVGAIELDAVDEIGGDYYR